MDCELGSSIVSTFNFDYCILSIKENVLVLRKYTLKYLVAKG